MLTFQNCGSSVLGSCGHILTKSVSDLCLRVHVSMCPKSPRPLSTQRSLGHPAPSTQPRGQEGQEVCWALKAGVGGGAAFLWTAPGKSCSSLRSQSLIPGIPGSAPSPGHLPWLSQGLCPDSSAPSVPGARRQLSGTGSTGSWGDCWRQILGDLRAHPLQWGLLSEAGSSYWHWMVKVLWGH